MGISLTGSDLAVRYVPGESDSRMFGGNSNWRGPIWFPVNVLLTDSLRRYALGMAAHLEVEYPTGSGQLRHVVDIADDLDSRLVGLSDRPGRPPAERPATRANRAVMAGPPHFSEHFHGDSGAGLGGSHQTGWTALVAHLVCLGED